MDAAKVSAVCDAVTSVAKRLDAHLARRADADFKEGDHPRAQDGKFGSGGGGKSASGGADKTKIGKDALKSKLEGMSHEKLSGSLKNKDVDPAIKKLIEKELDDRANRGTSKGFGEK